MATLIRAFRDLPGRNVYFSCKQERQKDEASGANLYYPSMPGQKLGQGLAYYFDFVFALRVEKDVDGNPLRVLQTARDFNYECKDRSGALDLYMPPNLAEIVSRIKE
jgi:hypothetical protein